MSDRELNKLRIAVRQMNSAQLSAFWKWIMLEYMQRCREEYNAALPTHKQAARASSRSVIEEINSKVPQCSMQLRRQ